MTNVAREVREAEARLRPWVRDTPLEPSPYLSRLCRANVYCKLENLQHTGSFKLRGALNKILSLTDAERERGVVAASTGNHGAAVAWALRELGVPGVVFVTEGASPAKLRTIEELGAEVRPHGADCIEAEAHARGHAAEHGMTYVSPYNDPRVVGGQGTVGLEIARRLAPVDAVFVSLGGGGLISGVAGFLRTVKPTVHVVGCSPERSRVMIESVRAGEILDLPSLPTLSDGTAGGVEAGAITFELCRELVDEYVTVTEDEIAANLREFLEVHHMLIEGAAAVSLASLRKTCERYEGKNVVVVICGANIGLETLRTVLPEA